MGARSYGQYCGLARALDVVGDRWTLLVVRELLVRPARYGELASALPGLATNLLAERLRRLVEAGVAERRLAEDGRGVVYALTAWGAQLREPVEALVRWSTPLMRPGPGGDAFRPEWLAVALRALLHDRTGAPAAVVGLRVDGALVAVRLGADGAHVDLDPDPAPATVLHAAPEVVLGLAARALDVEQAVARGVLHGDRADLAAVFASPG